jgi:hypothetical protein
MERTKPHLSNKNKEKIGKYFFRTVMTVEVVLLIFVIGIMFQFLKGTINVYSTLALGLIVLWVGIVIAYYAWSIYFYNINFGLTDNDWDEIGDTRDTSAPRYEPETNPNAEQTFGLPPGTVRGTIAVSMLVGALALIIVSFGKENIIKDNEILVDSFDFFKTAFLMMIAFYFGQKSLEYLLPAKKKTDTEAQTPTATPAPPPEQEKMQG